MTTLDPAFYVAQRKELTLPESVRSQWVSDALAHHVARCPRDLRCHVQRVLLHQLQGQGEALFAALLDIFIVLGASGYALRERLSRVSASLLSNQQRDFFTSHMASGISAGEIHPPAPLSRLSLGASGSFDFITCTSKEMIDTRPPIVQALDYITFGQLDLAQQTLEEALIANPYDDAICLELSQLYKRTRNIEALNQLLVKHGSQAPTILHDLSDLLARDGS